MSAVLFGALVAVFGLVVAPYLLVQAVIGFTLLEVVDYLEHYGLLRQRREDGRDELTRPEHSWNGYVYDEQQGHPRRVLAAQQPW
jgi:alkane 1-monooxygenase